MTETERQMNGEVLRQLQENRDMQEKITQVKRGSIVQSRACAHGKIFFERGLEFRAWQDFLKP